jgi:hypothetical protein
MKRDVFIIFFIIITILSISYLIVYFFYIHEVKSNENITNFEELEIISNENENENGINKDKCNNKGKIINNKCKCIIGWKGIRCQTYNCYLKNCNFIENLQYYYNFLNNLVLKKDKTQGITPSSKYDLNKGINKLIKKIPLNKKKLLKEFSAIEYSRIKGSIVFWSMDW